jgi:ATP-binding cassette subfamily B protein
VIEQWALQGRFDWGWFVAWAFIVALVIPFRLYETWLQGQIAFRAGALLKQRLLAGALRLEPEEMRHQGCGQLLGRVLEAEAVESLALSGGFLGLIVVIELAVATVVLRLGAGAWLHVTLAGGWIVLSAAVMLRYFQARLRWTGVRLSMTHDLVERMVGHRTRLAQAAASHWHDGEDEMAEHYLDQSARMDGIAALLTAVVPRGWLIVGVLGLVPSFVFANSSPARLAVGLGGVLLVFRALQKLSTGSIQWIGAATAWRQLRQLFLAAGRPQMIGSPRFATLSATPGSPPGSAGTLLQGHDLVFRYRNRGEPVLRGCSFQIAEGDRVLLEGSSGAGKSTLASLLTGLRTPESGLLLLRGLDRQTLGAQGWRRGAVAAPQFHENHVLTGTFAFNLLMGRRWPPREQDFAKLEPLCRALGLGPVLDRMPAGLLQMVGESGWQLSHGEKSRLYVARALLQEADLVVLDESFAALDPENLRHALRCVLDRSRSLVVIAHP